MTSELKAKARGRPKIIENRKTSYDYYQTFKEKNNELIHTPTTCDLCGGKYQYFNKHHHQETKKHLLYKFLKEKGLNENKEFLKTIGLIKN
jgi:hypothetical protein